MEVLANGQSASTRFLISIDTQKIVAALKESPESFISYDALTELIGRDIQVKARHCLQSAQRILRRDHGTLWVAEQGKGVKRLRDEEIPAHVDAKRVRRIHRTSKLGARELTCVKDFGAMKPETQKAHNFTLSILGAFAQMTSAPRVRALKARMGAAAMAQLPLGKTLELFQ